MYTQIDEALNKGWRHWEQEGNRDRELVVNHLEGHREITTKPGLIKCLKFYYKIQSNFVENNYGAFDSIPVSYVVSSKLENSDYFQFARQFENMAKGDKIKEKIHAKHCAKNIWLVKPANENQGKGIKIFDKLEDISRFISSSL